MYRAWIDVASKEEMSYADFLLGLLEAFAGDTCQRREPDKAEDAAGRFPFREEHRAVPFPLKTRTETAGDPERVVVTFRHQGRSMVLISPPGTEKHFMSVAIGKKIIQLGYVVKFLMAQRLINEYVRFKNTSDRQKLMRSLAKVDLQIIGEFGYLPHDKEAGSLFYQCPCEGRGKKKTIITSNEGLRSWAEVIHDSSLATALTPDSYNQG